MVKCLCKVFTYVNVNVNEGRELPSRPVSYVSRPSHLQLTDCKRTVTQQIKLRPHSPWTDWESQTQPELTGPWEWWPQSRSTFTAAPQSPLQRMIPLNPKHMARPKFILQHTISASFLIRQEITFLCWVNSLSIQEKMCFLRKWKSLIYPEIFLGRNSVVFEYRWEIKNAGVFHSSFINEVGCIKAQ